MIAARAQLTPESSHFFLRRQLLSVILRYIKSEHFRYTYISLELILTPSLTQLMPVGDGDLSPCLVTPHADEHKRPIHIYTHTPHAVFKIYKILSVFISNKIQEYYNKKCHYKEWRKYLKLDLSPKPGTSMGCPNLLPQHIVRDVICVKHMLACHRSVEGANGRNTTKGG